MFERSDAMHPMEYEQPHAARSERPAQSIRNDKFPGLSWPQLLLRPACDSRVSQNKTHCHSIKARKAGKFFISSG